MAQDRKGGVNRRHAALLAAGLGCGLWLSGCWDVRDINERTPILAMGFDHSTSEGWRVTAAESLLNPGGAVQYTGVIHRGEGRTLSAATEDLRARLARRLYLGSARIFALGKGVVAARAPEVVRMLAQRNEVDETAFLVGAEDTAEKLLGHPDGAVGLTAVRLLKEFEGTHQARDGHVTTRLWEAQRSLMALPPDRFLELPMFAVPPSGSAKAVGTALVGPSGREVLLLDREASVPLHWLQGESGSSVLQLADGREVKTLDVGARTQFADESHQSIQLRVVATAYYLPEHNIVDSATQRALEQETAREVLRRTIDLLQRLQRAGVDPAGWGQMAAEAGLRGYSIREAEIGVTLRVRVLPYFAPSA